MSYLSKKMSAFLLTSTFLLGMVGCSNSAEGGTTTSGTGSSSSSSSSSGTATGVKDVLTLGCSNFSDTLDPAANPNSGWGTARYGIGEGLFAFDQAMNAVEQLCDGYEVNEEKTVWEFHIREGVQFSNGVDLTASKVRDSFEYLYAQEASGLVSNTPSQYMAVDSFEADDETGVFTINTSKAYADLPKVLSHVNFIVMDTDSDMDVAPVGTGPYGVVSNDVGVSILLEKNEFYWKDEVPFEQLKVVFIGDSTTKALALQAGDVDMVDSVTTSYDLDTLRKEDGFTVNETMSARTGFSYVNYNGVLGNDVLREAIFLAVDDDTICDVTVGGVYNSGFAILPPTLDYGSENLSDLTPYNLEKATTMLDEAGIVDTDGDGIRELDGENIHLDYVGYVGKSLESVAEGVAMCLADLGIGVNLKIMDFDSHWNNVVNSNFDLAICSWITVPVGDPVGFMENWYPDGSMNYGGYENDTYNELYAQLLTELDVEVQKDMLEQLQQILIDDCAALVHGYYKSNLSNNDTIQGVEISMAETYWITTDIKPN